MLDTDHCQHAVIWQKNEKKKESSLQNNIKKVNLNPRLWRLPANYFLYLATTKKRVLLNDGTGC